MRLLSPDLAKITANLVEHPELVANRIITFAEIVGQENVIAGTDCGLGAASIRKSPGPSCAPCATAPRSRARSYGVDFKTACAVEGNKKQKFYK